jgi:hypothetical protein
VHPGLGTTGVPVRFGVPPEITLFTLVGAGDQPASEPSERKRR